ncbi:peptidase s8 s53 subtilisin kexin sedolisin [Fusarium heterosporum]|uniref:Peptidase s8 s53 subtilisin kexin sedolisin n=1 Tax=Fusarium heterosporum TaxID=42747 RepID=A0A8H5TM07_FUSHE|nr:peptidase s8 s53 subtilisin kexin sedolisin [Fusarium heterosporum]
MLVSYVIITRLSGSFAVTGNAAVGTPVIPFLFIFFMGYDIALTEPLSSSPTLLRSGPQIFGTAFNDDDSRQVTLPFAISAFGSSGSDIYVSTNGFVTVNSNTGSSSFSNQPLPYDNVASVSIFPYWDDLAISGDGQDRIEYEVSGDSGQRIVTINWCVKTLSQQDQKSNQFTATFYENDEGIALFRYYKTTQGGSSATVGGQNYDANDFVQYEYNQDDSVADRSFVRLDMTGGGSFTTGTF